MPVVLMMWQLHVLIREHLELITKQEHAVAQDRSPTFQQDFML
jgi:hypothetical protein